MSTSFTNATSIVDARPRVGFVAASSWSMQSIAGCTAHMTVNSGHTTGTTESKRLTPGDLTGALT